MSTSITNLSHNKKFYTNVHPKEIELGRQWQWTFRDCYVGRESRPRPATPLGRLERRAKRCVASLAGAGHSTG